MSLFGMFSGDFVFRTAYSDVYEGAVLGRYCASVLGLSRLGVLYVDNAYGQGLEQEFTKSVVMEGAEVVCRETFAEGATGFRSC